MKSLLRPLRSKLPSLNMQHQISTAAGAAAADTLERTRVAAAAISAAGDTIQGFIAGTRTERDSTVRAARHRSTNRPGSLQFPSGVGQRELRQGDAGGDEIDEATVRDQGAQEGVYHRER